MRLIDADAFKEYICNVYERVKHMCPDGGEWARQITEGFCEDIDEQPTIEPQKWNPCSKRLPNIKENHASEPCIVYCENGAYGFAELEENIFGQVGWDCEREDDYHEPLGNVIAWMPLPEPWKGEEE